MPRVSAFYGIVIRMFHNETNHPGRPHFHAEFAGVSASYDIETLEPIVGRLPAPQPPPRGQGGGAPSRRAFAELGTLSGPSALASDRTPVLSGYAARMDYFRRLLEVRPTESCNIWLRFEDGVAAEVDFSFLLDYEGVFLPLRNPNFFGQVRIHESGITIEWPGELDFDPEAVYRRTKEAAGVAA
jgi:Protein of unknown function (DUF2442)/Domain of unknown function (DUF4160)